MSEIEEVKVLRARVKLPGRVATRLITTLLDWVTAFEAECLAVKAKNRELGNFAKVLDARVRGLVDEISTVREQHVATANDLTAANAKIKDLEKVLDEYRFKGQPEAAVHLELRLAAENLAETFPPTGKVRSRGLASKLRRLRAAIEESRERE